MSANLSDTPSSVSDTSQYRTACAAAANDPELFRVFRRTREISGIIEPYIAPDSPDRRFAPSMREVLERFMAEPDLLVRYPSFILNDMIGDPPLEPVDGLPDTSIYTLRYIKIAYDLRRLFGSLDELHIVEIGGGYGGQCAILSRLFKWASYTIIDLPEVHQLQQAYLAALRVENVIFRTQEQIGVDERFDFFISNYAYSELSAELRGLYLDRVIAKSDRGFMLWNYLVLAFHRNNKDYLAAVREELEELAKILGRVPGLRFADHLRLSNDTEFQNHVAVWGNIWTPAAE
jgi:hypothetical protein